MIKRFLYLNGLAILGVVLFHAGGWGLTAMFAWSDRFLPATVSAQSQIGSISYYLLKAIEQISIFSIPAFLFVSGFFVAFKSSNQNVQALWKSIGNRIKFLLIPYFLWTSLYILFNFLQGRSANLQEIIVDYLTGAVTPAYYFVILLIQFYLLSPFLVTLAKKNWKLLLFFTAFLQLLIDFIPYVISVFPHSALLVQLVRLIPKWIFIARLFWFTLGIIIGLQRDIFQRFIIEKRKLWLISTILLYIFGLVERELLFHWSGGDWIGTRETPVNALYAIAFLFTVLSFNKHLPLKNPIESLGAQSFGIYLVHIPAMELVARIIYHAVPTFLGHTVLFTILIAISGLFIPLLVMKVFKVLPVKRFYGYVFG